MSKEVVKWHPAALVPGSKMDTALAKLRQTEQVERRARQTPPALSPRAGEVVDLPRMCAVHDKPYTARYVAGGDGCFHYAQTIRVTEALFLEQYADSVGQTRLLQGNELAEEFCPWCGAHGCGSVRCGSCGKEVCYGKTVGRYFRCRDSCGGQGTMVPEARTHQGVTPGSPHKGGYSAR
jgi:hypothetical protein